MKIKFARVRGERIAFQSGATSDYLAILSPLGACQWVCLSTPMGRWGWRWCNTGIRWPFAQCILVKTYLNSCTYFGCGWCKNVWLHGVNCSPKKASSDNTLPTNTLSGVGLLLCNCNECSCMIGWGGNGPKAFLCPTWNLLVSTICIITAACVGGRGTVMVILIWTSFPSHSSIDSYRGYIYPLFMTKTWMKGCESVHVCCVCSIVYHGSSPCFSTQFGGEGDSNWNWSWDHQLMCGCDGGQKPQGDWERRGVEDYPLCGRLHQRWGEARGCACQETG